MCVCVCLWALHGVVQGVVGVVKGLYDKFAL